MEAINSEESEDDVVQRPIYDWRRDSVNNRNIEINRRTGSQLFSILRKNTEQIPKTKGLVNHK